MTNFERNLESQLGISKYFFSQRFAHETKRERNNGGTESLLLSNQVLNLSFDGRKRREQNT